MKNIILGGVLLFSMSCAFSANYTHVEDGNIYVNDNALDSLASSAYTTTDSHQYKRDMILKSYAIKVGMQYGYSHQLAYLQSKIEKKSSYLDQIFNFRFLMSYANEKSPAVNILPPVLLKANNYILDEGGRAIVISKHHYRLYSQAKLVTVVPSWSDYLISSIPAPKPVVKAYLPHNDNEKVVWSSGIQHGWLLGIKQANQEMDYRINRLNRDYNGMITYLKLLDEGKVSAPYIAYTHQSVIGNNEAMSVNQNVYRITSNAKLVVNPKNWKFVSQEKI